MVTPTMTFRVRAERQDAVREVVNAIKDDPDLTASVLQVLHARSTNGSTTATTGNLGPFRSEDAALSFLVGRLTASLRPEAIFLFGSRAAGREKPTSDFDLLVILPNNRNGPADYFAAYAPVAGCGVGVDVIPCRNTDFEADRDRPGTIAFAADQKGRLLYARPGSPLRERFRSEASRR